MMCFADQEGFWIMFLWTPALKARMWHRFFQKVWRILWSFGAITGRHTAARQERGIKSVLEVNLRKSGAEHSIKRVLGVTWWRAEHHIMGDHRHMKVISPPYPHPPETLDRLWGPIQLLHVSPSRMVFEEHHKLLGKAWQKDFQLPSKQWTVMLEKTCVGHYWTHLISASNPANMLEMVRATATPTKACPQRTWETI